MANKIIVGIVIVLLYFSSFCSLVLGEREKKDLVDYSLTDYQVTNFSGFEQGSISSYITSSKTSDKISMSLTTGAFSTKQTESYILNFTDPTSIDSLELELSFNYTYTGSILSMIYIAIGSNYYENGSYGRNFICKLGVWDAWIESGGVFFAAAYPNNIIHVHQSSYGAITSSENYTVFIKLTSDILICMIKEDTIERYTQCWIINESMIREIDFLCVGFNADPIYIVESYVNFNSLDLKLIGSQNITITETRTIVLPAINFIATIVSIVFSIFIIRGVDHFKAKKK